MVTGAGVIDFFFFQAEDGIRDLTVTGVQTCALPIYARSDDRGNFSFTRTSRLRLELGADPKMSGAGEKIAVLFRKSDPDQLCDLFNPDLEPYADGFTRWGRDPLHETPVIGFIDPARLL